MKVEKINVDSNLYVIDKEIVIDTGPRQYRELVKKKLAEVVDASKIKIVIFTHLHYDHSGNYDLFPNAEFYASEDEIEDFRKNRVDVILDPGLASEFNIELKPLHDMCGLKVIKTPGHTRGSISLWNEKEKILFSGDALFGEGCYGRIDLPTSVPEKMQESLDKLGKLGYKKLYAGHDYV